MARSPLSSAGVWRGAKRGDGGENDLDAQRAGLQRGADDGPRRAPRARFERRGDAKGRRRDDRQLQRRRRACLDDGGEIAHRFNREQRLVEPRQGQFAAARERRAGTEAPAEAVQPSQRRSAPTGFFENRARSPVR